MTKLLFVIFVIIIPKIMTYLCPEPDICTCDTIYLNCICNARQDITLTAVHNYDITQMLIRGCGRVLITMGAISQIPLENIELIDISQLNLRPFVFAMISSLKSIKIADVTDFQIRPHLFAALNSGLSLTIHNVTADTLVTETASLNDIKEVIISDSFFNKTQTLALRFANVTSFRIINSHFNCIANKSFLGHGLEQVVFSQTTIQETQSESFSFMSVENLIFENCSFGLVAPSTLVTENVKNIHILQCKFDEIEPEAFSKANVINKIQFLDNTIKVAHENSIIPNEFMFNESMPENLHIEIVNNSFTCDCDISWLWTNHQRNMCDLVLNQSFCINALTKKLSSMAPVLNSEGQCVKLAEKIIDSRPLPSQYSGNGKSGSLPLELEICSLLFMALIASM